MNYVVATNAAVSLLGGLCLLLLWRMDRTQLFVKNIALAQLCNLAAVMSYIAWRGAHPSLQAVGLGGIAFFSAAVISFGTRAVLQLAGKAVGTVWQTVAFVVLVLAYFALLGNGLQSIYGWLNTLIYLGVGLYGSRLLWAQPWPERLAALVITLLGLNFLHVALLGEAALIQQLAIGTVLRVVLFLVFAIAAVERTRALSERMRQRFEKLSEHSFQGILIADEQSVLYANGAARRILGPEIFENMQSPSLQKLIGLKLLTLQELSEMTHGGQPFSEIQRDALRADGSAIHVRMSSWLTQWDGKPAVHILLLDDTGRYLAKQQVAAGQAELEKQRVEFVERSKNALIKTNAELEMRVVQRTHALEQANLAKSQFLANMSHELRPPMNVILGLLQLLRGTPLSSLQLDYSDKAERAAKSLLGLLNDILDFSKIDAGKMELDIQPFEPERLMRDLSVILSGSAAGKPVEVLFDLDAAMPAAVMGDSMRLLQVLINLCSNAVKFTPQGVVIVKCSVLQTCEAAVTLRFAVQDNGIGIAPENQRHIFDVFSQAEASTTRRFGGTGLGLSICKRLLDLMGSKLMLESTEGQGSHFHFDLQLPVAERLPDSVTVPRLPQAGPLSVLVVDDNAQALRLISTMTASLGWNVDGAQSGRQAIDLVQDRLASGHGPHHVVFIDWEMDGLDGWQTLERLESLYPLGQEPVVVMVSSHGRESLNQRSERELSQLSAYLIKPVTSAMLAEAVDNAFQGRGNLRASARAPVLRQTRLDGMRILLVEDNPLNQLVARELLRAEGALVETADHGRAGVDAVAQATVPYDVVLMDMQMPVMDGCTATRAIRRMLAGTPLPVIAMTANTMQSDRDACISAGMNDHVGKPFDITYLIEVLRRHTGRMSEQEQRLHAGAAPAPVAPDNAIAWKVALQDMGGDQDLYRQVLGAYLQELPLMPDQLAVCLQTADRNTAQRMVHTFKGISATVGATAMAAQALLLEHELKDPQSDLAGLSSLPSFLKELQLAQAAFELVLAGLVGSD